MATKFGFKKTYLLKDVDFIRCEEYSPFSPRRNALGLKTFWRADYAGESIAYGDTKAECRKEARSKLQQMRELEI